MRNINTILCGFLSVLIILLGFAQVVPAADNNILTYGSQGEKVYTLENMLHNLGYNVGTVAPYYTYLTKKAVSEFQKNNGLEVTGKVDVTTWEKIEQAYNNEEPENTKEQENENREQPGKNIQKPEPQKPETGQLKLGDSGKEVLELERRLDSRGYNVGAVAPYYTFSTKKAVMEFQRDNGLPVTGVADAKTLKELGFAVTITETKNPNPPSQKPKPDTTAQPLPEPNKETNTSVSTGNSEARLAPVSKMTPEEKQMVELVNKERAKHGLKPLKVNLRLVRSARMKSQDMIENDYFGHYGGEYGSPWALIRKAEPEYKAAGENLAGNRSVTAAHEALMNSPGHRANILSEKFTEIGIGIVKGGPYGYMITQHFISK